MVALPPSERAERIDIRRMAAYTDKKLVIACGGTGGHLFPGIAVAEAWTAGGGEALLLVSEKQIDALAAEGCGHLRFERLPSVAMPRLLSLKTPLFFLKLLGSLSRCRRLFKEFGADAVLGMGGFTSAAPLLAGRLLGLPTAVHESNAIPGRANRLNARFARSILLGFEACAKCFPGREVAVVGTPLRPSMKRAPSRETAAASFGLDPSRPVLLAMGGSQGARRLNELVAASLPDFVRRGVQVLHISGPLDHEAVLPRYEETPDAGTLLEFCHEMERAYAAADLVVCRAGASTLCELAFFEKPAVLVPYPFAADDHQTLNAELFSRPGAALLRQQKDLDEAGFVEEVADLLSDRERLGAMAQAMAGFSVPDAAERVCAAVTATVGSER